ncbi:5'-nucleotidase, lipoprotein e(P4) family [Psittacicella gerlachiana]|uniref:5'-nucleotidase, lipoprotein e(P4) family n=1 Tax=Psittacicella gerlachiana TaxID=2028574 RepID=A0A3A1Y7X7_9GAMM|nr:HAD family acid phosphatase [Psittacicella gerlachiana]RIY33329.1 hypothetical protein CKF59_06475 [Psittacicella gerlachiana]
MTNQQIFTIALILLLSIEDEPISLEQSFYTAEQIFGQQLVSALLWQQQSAEYKALCYQVFNQAQQALRNLNTKGTILIDVDETLLDNSTFEAGLSKYGLYFQAQAWDLWEREGAPSLVPGALEFVKFAHQWGAKVYYVSNRYGKNLQPTIELLTRLGFPQVSKDTLLLQFTNDYSETKQKRIKRIIAQENVIMFVGDMIDDFYTEEVFTSNQERKLWVEKVRSELGSRYIILPNPVYGNWMTYLQPGFYNLELSEQNKVAISTLIAWEINNYQ